MKRASEIYSLISDKYNRFPEQNHCIYRSVLDPDFKCFRKSIRTNMIDLVNSGKSGFSRVDLALAAAAWTINKHMPYAYEKFPEHSPKDYIPEEIRNKKSESISPKKLTTYVKKAARFFGASLVGITKIEMKWLYKSKVELSTASIQEEKVNYNSPEISIPDDINYAVVIAVEMDADGINCAPTFLEFASAGLGYSKMSFIIACMAQFIRNLGYKAMPCANDTALSIPLAIDAGLGALGRIGILITKKFGPRIRLCKVLTNMPLVEDSPDIKFIQEVNRKCKNCRKCAEACDFRAISFDENPSYKTYSKSNNPGTKKWYVDVEKCYEAWIYHSTDCAKCIKICPYSNMPEEITPIEFWKQ